MNIRQSFQNMMNSIMTTLPKILVFLVVLAIGWIIARVIRRLVVALLDKVGFERMVDRGIIGESLRRSDYTASGLVASLAYYTILLIALQMAFGVFGPNPVSAMIQSIVAWLPKAIVAVILIVVAAAIASVVRTLVGTALGAVSYGRVVATIVGFFILGLGVIAALNQIGIATTVTTPVLITVLATVGAILAIGVGGGMVRPMQQRWERILTAAEDDSRSLRAPSTSAAQRGREDAMRGGAVRQEMPERTVPSGTTPMPPSTP